MSPELARLQTEVTKTLQDLTPKQIQASSTANPQSSSIQQIAEHLLAALHTTISAFQTLLDCGALARTVPTLPQRLARLTVLTLRILPRRLDHPSLAATARPSTLRTAPELLGRLSADLARLDALTTRVHSRFQLRATLIHPRLGPLSAPQWRSFHLIHGLYHLRQIRAIRRDHAF